VFEDGEEGDLTMNKIHIEDIRRIVERWGEMLKPHQNPDGKVTQLQWQKCWEMWQELAWVIHQKHQGKSALSHM
jgi:hypothetical protein